MHTKNKKLVRHGNSLALVLDKPLLKLLNIDENSTLELEIQGDTLLLRAGKKKAPNSSREKTIKEISNEIMTQYDSVFRRLAKT